MLAFGGNFPAEGTAKVADQAFALAIAAAGLLCFALVLALFEQVVMEAVEDNVKKGSRIFTSGHVTAPLSCFVSWLPGQSSYLGNMSVRLSAHATLCASPHLRCPGRAL